MAVEEQKPFEAVRGKLVAARISFLSQLAKFSKEELALPPDRSAWSPLQVAYHLYLADGVALEQMRLVQTEENPLLAPNETEVHPDQAVASAELPPTLDAVMAGMAARREELFQWLSNLPAEAWTRPYRHSRWGQLTFPQLVHSLAEHDQRHAHELAHLKQ